MASIKKFVFNAFQVNTYVLFDDSKECVIIDPGCSDGVESLQLNDFIQEEGLKPIKVLLTHTHIDHVLGLLYVNNSWFISRQSYHYLISLHCTGLVGENSLN